MVALTGDPITAAARERARAGAWREVVRMLEPIADSRSTDAAFVTLYGEALVRTGREREAVDWLHATGPVLANGGDGASYRRVLNLLGVALFALGDLDGAAHAFERALELANRAEDLLVMARATNNLGAIANLRGEHDAAQWHYGLAIPIYQRLGEPRGLAESHHNLAITCRDRGRLAEADEHERRAIDYALVAEAPRLVAMGRVGRAEVALRRGDPALAEATARAAAADLNRLADPSNEADAYRLIGVAAAARNEFIAAGAAFERALGLARMHHHALVEAETLRDRAAARLESGDTHGAVEDGREALTLFARLGAREEIAVIEKWLNNLLRA